MAEPSPITERELRFLRELVGCNVPFMIVGLSAAALQGAPTVTQDIHLWFRDPTHPGLRAALQRVGGAYVPPSVLNPPMFAGADLELFDIVLRMDGLGSFDEELRHAIDIMLGDCEVKVLLPFRPLARSLPDLRPTVQAIPDMRALPGGGQTRSPPLTRPVAAPKLPSRSVASASRVRTITRRVPREVGY